MRCELSDLEWANIPPKRNRRDPICFSPFLYRSRNLVERFFTKPKQCRRAATRYETLTANCLAFIKLASVRIWLRACKSTPRSPSGFLNGVAFILLQPLGWRRKIVSGSISQNLEGPYSFTS